MSAGAPDPGLAQPRPGPFAFARPVLREPIVYFVLLGALVFGVDRGLRKDEETIRITPGVRAEVARSLTGPLGHPPDAKELEAGIEAWKEEQALYREGQKMGLLDDDPSVRAHIAGKLLQVARERDVFPEPTDGELRAYFESHREQYRTPATFDFDLVFFAQGAQAQGDARARAEEALARLRAGAPPAGLGDWYPRGNRFAGEMVSDIAVALGDQAAGEIPGFAVGAWNLVAGRGGVDVVRVTAVDRHEPDFDRLRAAIAVAFEADRRDRAAQAYARGVESRYRFVDSR